MTYRHIQGILQIFLALIKIIKRRRLARQLDEDFQVELIILLSHLYDQMIKWLGLVNAFLKYLQAKKKKGDFTNLIYWCNW